MSRHSPAGSTRRFDLTLPLVIYALVVLALYARLFAIPVQRILIGHLPDMGGDFLALSIGGRIVAGGQGAHLYDLGIQARAQADILQAAGESTGPQDMALFVYPPFVALAFSVLASLPPLGAYLVWDFANLALLGAVIWTLIRTTGLGSRARQALLVLAVISFLPVWMVLLRGQVSFVMLALLLGCYLALRAGRDGLAGFCLALALLKPQLVVVPMLVLLAQRRWRALLGCLLGGILLVVLSLAVAGPDGVVQYLRLLTQVGQETGSESLVHPDLMFNWRGTAVRLVTLIFGETYPQGQLLALGLYAMLSLGSLGLLWWAWRGPWAACRDRLSGLWALTVLVAMLVSPHLHEYDLVLWLLAGALAVGYLRLRNPQLPAAWQGMFLITHALPLVTLGLVQTLRAQAGVAGSLVLAAGLWFLLVGHALGCERRAGQPASHSNAGFGRLRG
jgi:hypothetical protein